MDNAKLINGIFNTLENSHINLFHSISKKEFDEQKQKVLNKANSLTELELDYEMSKLFPLFKDAHTTYSGMREKMVLLNAKFDIINNNVYIIRMDENNNKLADKVLKINGIAINTILDKFKSVVCYETDEWLTFKITEQLSNFKYYKLLNISNPEDNNVNIETENGKFDINFNKLLHKRPKPYSFDIINNILYIRYSQCAENKDYPFKNFLNDIVSNTDNKITEFILDVRNNTGGNSEIINPLQNYLLKQKMKGVLLINEGTFSSGRFAVARFKRDLNVTLIGQPTGGAVKSYGYTKRLEVKGRCFSASIRQWDFSKIFNYIGAIQPDIKVAKKVSDLTDKTDSTLERAITYLQKENESECQL